MLRMCERWKYADCSWKCSACARKTKQKKVSLKFPEGNITSAKLQAEWIFGIRVPFVKNVSCSRESMAEYIDHTPAKSSPAKRRRFQMFKKTYYEKWPFITLTRKVTLVWTLKFTLLLWYDWTGGQSSTIAKQRSHSCGIGMGGAVYIAKWFSCKIW